MCWMFANNYAWKNKGTADTELLVWKVFQIPLLSTSVLNGGVHSKTEKS